MKAFGKKQKKPSIQNTAVNNTVTSAENTDIISTTSENTLKFNEARKVVSKKTKLISAICITLFGIGLAIMLYMKFFREKSVDNTVTISDTQIRELNKGVELEKAKKKLESNPNDDEALLSAAENSRDINLEESKKYFTKLLENYKEHNGLDDANMAKNALVYWGGAGLAEQAGKTDEAIKYYKMVIKTADPTRSYDTYISKESDTAIKRLEQ